jgi:hypothetical protein
MISKGNQAILDAVKKGYKIINGKVFYKGKEVKLRISYAGYHSFCIRMIENGNRQAVPVHRLVAYQKFGKKTFKEGVQVRHLDNNCLNNNDKNIAIGSPRDNNLDKTPEVRMATAIYASSFVKKHDHAEIVRLHNENFSYKQIMEKLKIKSKGTISFIINKSMEVK